MSDEPLFKKKLDRFFGRNKGEAMEQKATDLSAGMPSELVKILSEGHHDTPVLLHKIRGIIKREHLKVDTATLQEYARQLGASKKVMDAITALRTSAHEAAHLSVHLERSEELADEKHQTGVLREKAERAQLHGVIDQHETARLEEQIKRDRIRRRAALAAVGEDFAERVRRSIEQSD